MNGYVNRHCFLSRRPSLKPTVMIEDREEITVEVGQCYERMWQWSTRSSVDGSDGRPLSATVSSIVLLV